MDYEAADRHMSSWVVKCRHNGTTFYLTDEGLATDNLARAVYFRWAMDADTVADDAREEYAWKGFNWQAATVAEESAFRALSRE